MGEGTRKEEINALELGTVKWMLSQEIGVMLIFKKRLISIVEHCLENKDVTKETFWKEKAERETNLLIEEIEADKMLGLVDRDINVDKCAKAFSWIARDNDLQRLNSVVGKLIVETHPKFSILESAKYEPPTTKEIAEFLVRRGDLAIELFFWEGNKARKLFTDEERIEIRNLIDKLTTK